MTATVTQLAKVWTCGSCFFWRSGPRECRRYAPRPAIEAHGEGYEVPEYAPAWPKTAHADGCGDWKNAREAR